MKELIDSRKDSLRIRVLNCFSALNNSRKIISTKDNVKDSLSCLHGIRALSTLWLVFYHMILENMDRYGYSYNRMTKVCFNYTTIINETG